MPSSKRRMELWADLNVSSNEPEGDSVGRGLEVTTNVATNGHGYSYSQNGVLADGHADLPNGSPKKQEPHETMSKREKTFAMLQEQRRQLPITKGKQALIEELWKHDVTIILGETGSGKTTQVPQYILESGLAGSGIIAVTQTRRVAATTLAERVAVEQNGKVGQVVGYSVRFDECWCDETRIKYMTDGMIVREMMLDPLLTAYSVIVVDEAHERSLRTDLLLANLKRLRRERNLVDLEAQSSWDTKKAKEEERRAGPLKIVVMSATLDAEKFSAFFCRSKVLYVEGRQHLVKVYYSSEGQTDYVDSAMRTFFQIHLDRPPGDVLIFLPGQEDIESLEKSIRLFAKQLPKDENQVLICPMFAAQAPGQNAKVFVKTPPDARKCILATNIAETSITIPGVKYVIDTGMGKEKIHVARDTGGGFDALLTRPITKSSAMQRLGRAGREGPGMCFRLYTEDAYNKMEMTPEPEITRVSLTSSTLQLKYLGQNIEELELMDMPDIDSVHSALKTLWLLEAIDDSRTLTQLGRQMASFPLEPMHARLILASKDNGCTLEVLDIVSVLSASSKLFIDITDKRDAAAEARRMFIHPSGDHLTVLNAVRAYADLDIGPADGKVDGDVKKSNAKAVRGEWCHRHFLNERTLIEAAAIREQLRRTCEQVGVDWWISCGEKEEPVVRSLAQGLAMNSAFLQVDGSYKQTMGHSFVKIHPGSVLAERQVPAIIYDELIFTKHTYARGVTSVPKSVFAQIGALNRRIA